MSDSIKSPKVSVIVPNYNHAPFLAERLNSILAQTFRDFELIVLDDASTDDSIAVIRDTLRDCPYRLIENKANSGIPCSQWLKGISASRGDLIWIAESDDTCSHDFLEHCIENFTGRTLLTYTRTRTIDESGSPCLEDFFWPDEVDPKRWHQNFNSLAKTELSHYLAKRNTLPNASSVVFRRPSPHHLRAACHLRYTGDWVFWSILMARYKEDTLTYLASPLSFHRNHQATTRFASHDRSSEISRLREYSTAALYVNKQSAGFSSWNLIQAGLKGDWDWMYRSYVDSRPFFHGLARYLPPFQNEVAFAFWFRLFLDPHLGKAYLGKVYPLLLSLRLSLRSLRLSWKTRIALIKHYVRSRLQ